MNHIYTEIVYLFYPKYCNISQTQTYAAVHLLTRQFKAHKLLATGKQSYTYQVEEKVKAACMVQC